MKKIRNKWNLNKGSILKDRGKTKQVLEKAIMNIIILFFQNIFDSTVIFYLLQQNLKF